MRSTAALVLLLATLLVGGVAAGQVRREARARELFQRAEVHFNLREFAKALELYTEAYKIRPLPGFLFNIGQCQRYLGRYEEALFSFRIYLARVAKAPNRTQTEELIRETEKKLAAQRASGVKPPPPVPPPAPLPREARVAPPPRPAALVPDGRVVRAPADQPAGPRPLWLWTGAGIAGALVVSGVVTGQLASNRSERYNDDATPVSEREGLKREGERLRTSSIVCFSVAGAAAIGTTLYYLLAPRRPARAARISVGAGGLAVSGEF